MIRYDFLEGKWAILNQLQLYLITLLVNFSYQVGTMMSRYDFLEARRVILRNFRTDYNLK